MNEHKFEKEYQLWINYGYEGWGYQEFDTLEECINYPKYGEKWKISRRADFEIKVVEVNK